MRTVSNIVHLDASEKGVDGRTTLAGARAPIMRDGRIGDFWIDTRENEQRLYGPKTAGGWPDLGLIKGNKGWTPVLAAVENDARRVMRVIDWQGGEGTKPPTGKYVGPNGLVDTVALGMDIRGPIGVGVPDPSAKDGNFLVAANDDAAWRTPAEARQDIGLGNVNDTSDTDKPVSTAQQAAFDLKAELVDERFIKSDGSIRNIVDFGVTEASSNEDMTAAFQDAIDALPLAGGMIVVPQGDWSSVDASALVVPLIDVGSGRSMRKQVSWVAYGAVLPREMPGAVIRAGQHREWSDAAGTSGRDQGRFGDAFMHLRAESMNPQGQNQQDAIMMVEGYVPADTSGLDNEAIGYKFVMSSSAKDENAAIRGIRGTVTGQGGKSKVRGGRIYGVGKDGHSGILTGFMVGIRRVGVIPTEYGGDGSAQWTQGSVSHYGSSLDFAFVGQTGEGIRGAFLAQGFNGEGGDTPQSAFAMGYGNQAIKPSVAAVDLHAGGAGDVIRVMNNEAGTTKIAAVKKDGSFFSQSFRSTENGLQIPDDGVAVIPLSKSSGLFKFWTANAMALFGEVYYRSSDGQLQQLSKGTLVTLVNNTVLTGTTGTDGNMTISCSGNNLYIENRTGGQRHVGFVMHTV